MDSETLDQRFDSIVFVGITAFAVVGFLTGAAVAGRQDAASAVVPSGWPLLAGILLLVIAAVGGVVFVGHRTRNGPDESAGQALEELRTAYARGDVGEEEFERRRERLERDG